MPWRCCSRPTPGPTERVQRLLPALEDRLKRYGGQPNNAERFAGVMHGYFRVLGAQHGYGWRQEPTPGPSLHRNYHLGSRSYPSNYQYMPEIIIAFPQMRESLALIGKLAFIYAPI